VWVIERPLRLAAGSTSACAVPRCGRPAGRAAGDKPRETDVLCVAHRRRHLKSARKLPVRQFIDEQAAASPICAPRGAQTRKPHYPPIDFTRLRPRVAHELRYIVAHKLRRGGWGDNEYIHSVLRYAVAFCEHFALESLLQHPLDKLTAKAASGDFLQPLPTGKRRGGRRNFMLALPSMIRLLHRATPDPWDSGEWHTEDVGYPAELAGARRVLHWDSISCRWLRDGLRSFSRDALQAGTRSWSTIETYIRGASSLSRFFEEEAGDVAPPELTRRVFLDFVSWARSDKPAASGLTAINALAKILVLLRADGYVPQLPDTTFLLRGENVIVKERKPRPFPADILAAVDRMITEDGLLEDDVRLLLRVFRATGPRATEALHLPRDCVCYVDGRGYSLEYFMTKTDNWRRIPIPGRLGKDLARQAEKVAGRFGSDCLWLFPYTGRSPRTKTLTRGVYDVPPWSYGKFTSAVWGAYERNKITSSSTTGETLSGPGLHRFRHSVATGLLNEGWSQYEVQKFLGHKSPTMMQAYAEIHDDTLRAKYEEFASHAIDINGEKNTQAIKSAADRERLRDRMIRSTLPNGYCTLPDKQACDFVPTPCLSCKPFFRTTPTFLPVHIRQRDETLRQLELARQEGRQRAIEAHEKTLDRLNTIIDGLEKEKTEPCQPKAHAS
jgi:integrase